MTDELSRYRDSYGQDRFEERRLEAREELTRLLGLMHFREAPRIILDVGCGSGAVASVLTELFPTTQIYGIDWDWQAAKLQTPANLVLIRADVQKLLQDEPDFFAQADLTVALRTSAGVALQLLEHAYSRGGSLITSIITESEGDATEARFNINQLLDRSRREGSPITIVPLKEMRGHNELAYIIS